MESVGGKCYQLYQELLELSKEQVKAWNNEDFNEETSLKHIEELLAKRQELIDKIDSIKGDYQDIAERAEIQKIIKEIIELDQQSIQFFSQQRKAIKQRLATIQRGKQSNKAYEPYSYQSDGYFVDQKK